MLVANLYELVTRSRASRFMTAAPSPSRSKLQPQYSLWHRVAAQRGV
ncbi:hypothetical protein MT997_00030 [Paenibacillus sp. OVF10]|nr:hypothetical protein MT997_00030 [Paenibacillus sp. OVF10]